MTIEEIKNSEKVCLSPAEAADALGCSPQAIRILARQNPERLGFPVLVSGTRTHIPRIPFLEYLGYATEA